MEGHALEGGVLVVVVVVVVKRRLARDVQNGAELNLALGAEVDPRCGVRLVLGDTLVELLVLVVGDLYRKKQKQTVTTSSRTQVDADQNSAKSVPKNVWAKVRGRPL